MKSQIKGFTLVEVLVGTFLLLLVFSAIFGAYQLALRVTYQAKARTTASALANQRIEEARNLAYGDMGTYECESEYPDCDYNQEEQIIPGYPSGPIKKEELHSRNNINYTVSTDIEYGINCSDGVGEVGLECPPDADDSCPGEFCPEDPCPNDYKKVRIVVSWSGVIEGEVSVETTVSPKTEEQECEERGGFLLVSVFDAAGGNVAFPDIRVEDIGTGLVETAVPASGESTFVLPGGVDAYKVEVSKNGYSQERTYAIGETYDGKVVADPNKPHFTVLENDFSEGSFYIDELSSFYIKTLSPEGADSFLDSFVDESKISEKHQVEISGQEAGLAHIQGVYFEGGTTDDNLCYFPGVNGDCGQSFTMGEVPKQASAIELYLKKTAEAPSSIYLEVRSDSVIGAVIGQSEAIDASGLPESFGWVAFSFPSSVNLSNNTQYFLRLRSVPDSTDPESGAQGTIYWGFAASVPAYSGGEAWRYIGKDNNPEDQGEQLISNNFSFKVCGDQYYVSGYLLSQSIEPADLTSWSELSWSDYEPAGAQILYRVLYYNGFSWELIPDDKLSGNAAGLSVSPIDLSGLSSTSTARIKIKANFATGDPSFSSTLYDWQVTWVTSQPTPIGNVNFLLTGDKIIGQDEMEENIYKYENIHSTDGGGELVISNLEWDSYTFSDFVAGGSSISLVESNPVQPVGLSPNVVQAVELFLESANNLLVTVNSIDTGEPLFSAQVRLYNSGLGYDRTQPTDTKGQTFFMPLETVIYNLEIQSEGYQNYSGTVNVSGDITKIVNLAAL